MCTITKLETVEVKENCVRCLGYIKNKSGQEFYFHVVKEPIVDSRLVVTYDDQPSHGFLGCHVLLSALNNGENLQDYGHCSWVNGNANCDGRFTRIEGEDEAIFQRLEEVFLRQKARFQL